jgi:hypothetical protein
MCNNNPETISHFLTCSNCHATARWEKSASTIKDRGHKLTIDPMLTRLLAHAIIHWRDTPHPHLPAFLPAAYINLFNRQCQIGWHQIILGRFTKLWATCQNLYSHTTKGLQQISTLAATILQQVYSIWKIRCNIQHCKTQLDRDNKLQHQLQPKVHAIYSASSRLTALDQTQFTASVESVLALPIHQLEHWIRRNTKFIQAGIKRAIHQDRINTPSIRQFFPVIQQTHPKRSTNKSISGHKETQSQGSTPHLNTTMSSTNVLPTTHQPSQHIPFATTTKSHKNICYHPSVYKPP